jgi:molecular chaperone IbpA
MTTLSRYNAGNIDKFLSDINRYSIGLDSWFDRIGSVNDTNYPPYNLVKQSDTEFQLELALAGFREEDLKVYTERNQLIVEASKEETDGREYVYRGLANRAFKRVWNLADDVEVRDVTFVNGVLSVNILKVVPEKFQKKLLFGSDKA